MLKIPDLVSENCTLLCCCEWVTRSWTHPGQRRCAVGLGRTTLRASSFPYSSRTKRDRRWVNVSQPLFLFGLLLIRFMFYLVLHIFQHATNIIADPGFTDLSSYNYSLSSECMPCFFYGALGLALPLLVYFHRGVGEGRDFIHSAFEGWRKDHSCVHFYFLSSLLYRQRLTSMLGGWYRPTRCCYDMEALPFLEKLQPAPRRLKSVRRLRVHVSIFYEVLTTTVSRRVVLSALHR